MDANGGSTPKSDGGSNGEAARDLVSIPTPSSSTGGNIWNPRYPLTILLGPGRISTIVQHRNEIVWAMKRLPLPGALDLSSKVNPIGQKEIPAWLTSLKSVGLRDLDPFLGTNNFGSKIELELIEDTNGLARVLLCGQDRNGQVVHVAMYHDTKTAKFPPSIGARDEGLQDKLGYGTRITIRNPYLKIALDGRTMLRVNDEADLFIHSDRDPKKCRFCSNPDAGQSCARCKRAFYCSKECQTHDWKVLKHKLICDAFNWDKNKDKVPLPKEFCLASLCMTD